MTPVRDAMLTASWQAGTLAVLVWLVTSLCGRWMAARWRCALWSLVFVRLVLPALPPSPLSLFNLRPVMTPLALTTAVPPPQPRAAGDEVVTFGVVPEPMPAAAAATPAPPATPHVWADRLTILWLTVAALLILRMACAYARLTLRMRRLPTCNDPRLLDLLGGTGLGAVETPLVTSPALVGAWRPRLLLPPGLIDRLTPDELRFVVLHELAHVRRFDVLVGAVVALIAALHWFNPLAWFAASRFRAERELACDEWVLARTRPEDRPAYGRTILRLLDLFPPPPRDRQIVGAAGVLSAGRAVIRRRIAAVAASASSSTLRRRPIGPLAVVVVALATLTGPAPSTSAPAPPASGPATTQGTVTRVYDVRDLLAEIPDFGDTLDERGWPVTTTRPTTSPATNKSELLAKLIAEITGTIDPPSWRENAGRLGSIRELRGQLAVTQTPANHEKVLRKLQQLRAPREVQVMLEARFLTGRGVPKALGDAFAADTNLYHRFLDRKEVEQLIRIVQSDFDASIITAPRMTLFNGQRGYVQASRETAYVAGFKPQEEKFESVTEVAHSGIVFNARVRVSDDRKNVTLTLNPRLSTLLALLPKRWPDAPPGREDLTSQQPLLEEIALDTTVTVPVGRTAAFRLYPAKVPTTNPLEPRPDPVVLLVMPMVIDEPEQPATRPASPTRAGVATTRPSAKIVVEPAPPSRHSTRPTPRPLDSRK